MPERTTGPKALENDTPRTDWGRVPGASAVENNLEYEPALPHHVTMPEARYAIYFAPPEGSGLERVGSAILGRCARTGNALKQPDIPGVKPARLAELTAAPRHYGLHATLKPPFLLVERHGERELLESAAAIASKTRPFDLPGLELSSIGSFLALTPSAPCPELEDLARICVTVPDRFRRPPRPEELARRRAQGLSPNQERLLNLWGYPYVLEEMRFHLTLTGRIHDPEERERIGTGLTTLLAPILHETVPLRDICVFRQPCLEEPFTILERFALTRKL